MSASFQTTVSPETPAPESASEPVFSTRPIMGSLPSGGLPSPTSPLREAAGGQETPSAPRDREALVQAHAILASATHRAVEVTEAASRGQAALEAARVALAEFAAVDQDIAAHRAASLRSRGSTELPAVLAARRKRRDVVQIEAEDAERTAELLDSDAAAAREVQASAARAVEVQVVLAQVAVGEATAMRARELEAEAGRLRMVAAGFKNILLGADPFSSRLAPAACSIPHDGMHDVLCELAKVGWRDVDGAWANFTRALREDPHAPVPAQLHAGTAA